MELRKCVTVVVVVVCVTLANAATQPVTGRCCARTGGGGGCETPSGSFSPPLSEETAVSWEEQDLDCNHTQTVAYYSLGNSTKGNHLKLIGDELILRFRQLFGKTRRDYCVEAHGEGYRAAVCQPNPEKICGGAVCIPKCCGEGEVLRRFTCVRGSGNITLPFYSFHGKPIPAPPSVVMVGDTVPGCGHGFYARLDDEPIKLHLLVSGKLRERERQVTHEFNHYCVEYDHDAKTQHFLVCHEDENEALTVQRHLMKIGYVISVVFLIVTLLFHVFIKSLQDTKGKCLMSYMVSMTVANVFLFIITEAPQDISWSFCLFSGFIVLFSFLAMFCWLNVMCYDIWRVIKATTMAIRLHDILSEDARQLRFYCLYAWGVPLVVVAAAAVMHTLPEEHAKNIVRPGFGITTCFLRGGMEKLIYCYAYVAVLFILDLVFLGHAMYMLHKAGGACMCCKQQDFMTAFNRSHLEAFWQRFTFFILMVLVWSTDVMAFHIPPREIWIVSGVVNSLQGFWVFLIFMSSRKRREMVIYILKRGPLPCCRTLRHATPSTGSQSTIWHMCSRSVSSPDPRTSVTDISAEK